MLLVEVDVKDSLASGVPVELSGLPLGEQERLGTVPLHGLCPPEPVVAWSRSSNPALVWNRLLRFTTRREEWVRTVMGPTRIYERRVVLRNYNMQFESLQDSLQLRTRGT